MHLLPSPPKTNFSRLAIAAIIMVALKALGGEIRSTAKHTIVFAPRVLYSVVAQALFGLNYIINQLVYLTPINGALKWDQQDAPKVCRVVYKEV